MNITELIVIYARAQLSTICTENPVKPHNPTWRLIERRGVRWRRRGEQGEWINNFSVISQSGRGTKVLTTLIASSLSPCSSSSSLTSVYLSVWFRSPPCVTCYWVVHTRLLFSNCSLNQTVNQCVNLVHPHYRCLMKVYLLIWHRFRGRISANPVTCLISLPTTTSYAWTAWVKHSHGQTRTQTTLTYVVWSGNQ